MGLKKAAKRARENRNNEDYKSVNPLYNQAMLYGDRLSITVLGGIMRGIGQNSLKTLSILRLARGPVNQWLGNVPERDAVCY
jgi:hypothetical protein